MSPLAHGRSLYFAFGTPSGGAVTSYSSTTQEVSGLPGEQDLTDVSVAGNIGHSFYPGLANATFTSKHVFDSVSTGTTVWGAVASFQSLQQTYPTAPWAIQFGPRGSTSGYVLMTCNAWITSVSLPVNVTEANTFTINWQVTGGTTGVTIGAVT
jgi:hypothetical protein